MGDKGPTVHARALQRAADILGGKEPLRVVLRVPMIRLDEWLAGHSEPPMDIFLRAVDIISAPTKSTAAAVRATVREPMPRSRDSDPVKRFLAAAFAPEERGTMLASALDAAMEATHAQMGNVQLKTQSGLEIATYRGFDERFLKFFACVSDGHGAACGAALRRGSRVIVGDVASDPIFAGTEAARVMQDASARAVQSTPLVTISGQVLGMVSTHFDKPHVPHHDELAIVDQIAQRTAYWLEKTKA